MKQSRKMKLNVIGLMVLIGIGLSPAHADDLNKTRFGVAIDGYDTTAYHSKDQAQFGQETYEHEWRGAKWRFATEAGRDKFAANPEKYQPQYGGFCANGMSEGHKIEGNPEIWRLMGDKLYLFYAERGRQRWASNTDQWIKDANRHWQTLKDE